MNTVLTRLHVSPLTPDLLSTVLGPNLIKIATNVSYHSLQSFPESNYGYIDLPGMEAERVKKKLNGAILKGKKIKIEEARPSKRKHATRVQDEDTNDDDDDDDTRTVTKKSKKSKTSGKVKDVLEGHELSPRRKVKRGWTEPKADKLKRKKDKSNAKTKSQTPSKYTEKEELLFRTQIPKNKSAGESKDTKKRKKSGKGADTAVVHEFEKSTTIPSFLRTEAPSGGQKATEYRDGKGWVDEQGQVVEIESNKASERRGAAKNGQHGEILRIQSRRSGETGPGSLVSRRAARRQDSSSTSSSDSGEEEEELPDHAVREKNSDPHEDVESTSSSGTSESESESVASSPGNPDGTQEDSGQSDDFMRAQPMVHPLEALFKRPSKPASLQVQANAQEVAKPSLEVKTGFSFFGHQADTNDLPDMPMTPFSTQDWRSREIRSAAPTPDTAHPSRMSSIFNGRESSEELSDMEDKDPEEPVTGQQQGLPETSSLQAPQTDFEKQFWEKRGDNNRAWKARRRAVLKDQRQRENRARRPKNW